MSGKINSYLIIITSLLLLLLACTGCVSATLKNRDIDPPTSGLLAALQTEQMPSSSVSRYKVTVTEREGKSLSVGKMELMLHVTDANGSPVMRYTEDMTKLMHLIVVSKDLSAFQHVHPEHIEGNAFRATLDFPYAGKYLFTTEFRPNKSNVTIHKQWIQVAGNNESKKPLLIDHALEKRVSGLDVTLSASPAISEIKAGQMVMMLYRFADAETGNPIKQIEPFLGTSGHCVIINSSADQFVHAHAMEAMSGGANVMFHTVFPEKGIYKLWGQFQYEGETVTVPFVIEVF
jgi:hypothetical protein